MDIIIDPNLSAAEAEKRFCASMTPDQVKNAYDIMVPDPEAQGRGYDLRSLAFRNRVLYLHGGVTTESMNLLCMQIQYLCAPPVLKDPRRTRRIVLYVSSPGGSVTAGLLLKEYIRQVKEITNEPVYVIDQEQAASMGSSITQSASPGCRFGFVSTLHMIHESAYGLNGKASEHAEQVGMNIKLESQFWLGYEQAMLAHRELFYGDDPNNGVLRAQIRHFLLSQCKRRDTFLTASEAQKLGLLDFVITSNSDQIRYYKAMEIYMGLCRPGDDEETYCDLLDGAGQSQPFTFDRIKLSEEEQAKCREEGLRRLRKLRDASLAFCSQYDAELGTWFEDLNALNQLSVAAGNSASEDIGKRIDRVYSKKDGVSKEDLFSSKNPWYMGDGDE